MLGTGGSPDSANVLLKRGDVGIPGDFEDFAAPKSLVPYSRGQIYYHEGLSLQECVLPCLTVRLSKGGKKAKAASVPSGSTRGWQPRWMHFPAGSYHDTPTTAAPMAMAAE